MANPWMFILLAVGASPPLAALVFPLFSGGASSVIWWKPAPTRRWPSFGRMSIVKMRSERLND